MKAGCLPEACRPQDASFPRRAAARGDHTRLEPIGQTTPSDDPWLAAEQGCAPLASAAMPSKMTAKRKSENATWGAVTSSGLGRLVRNRAADWAVQPRCLLPQSRIAFTTGPR